MRIERNSPFYSRRVFYPHDSKKKPFQINEKVFLVNYKGLVLVPVSFWGPGFVNHQVSAV